MNPSETNEEIAFDRELDLHCFAPHDTAYLVDFFLTQARERGLREVRIVHGKGKSAKKRETRKILESHSAVESYRDDGYNWGATLVILRATDVHEG